MSSRPLNVKRANRMRKLLGRQQLPTFINLIHWLKDRGYAQTTGEAKRLLTEGKVKTKGGNVLGRRAYKMMVNETETVSYQAEPLVDAKLRDEIVVLP